MKADIKSLLHSRYFNLIYKQTEQTRLRIGGKYTWNVWTSLSVSNRQCDTVVRTREQSSTDCKIHV